MEKDKLPNHIKSLANDLMELYALAYKQVKPKISYIIKNDIKDIKFIESVLEELLNIPTSKCYKLFIKLCDYVKTFNHKLANDYQNYYIELYGDETLKERKKTI